jgi:hypothetical protein
VETDKVRLTGLGVREFHSKNVNPWEVLAEVLGVEDVDGPPGVQLTPFVDALLDKVGQFFRIPISPYGFWYFFEGERI